MNRLKEILTINREFVFTGQFDNLKARLNKLKGMNYQVLKDREIKFSPYISLGTMAINGTIGFVDGINVLALISEIDSDQIKIKIKTKIRPEHYMIGVAFFLSLVGTIYSEESKWLIFYELGLWIIFHVWFQFIYRLQENYLIDKVVSKLRLSEI